MLHIFPLNRLEIIGCKEVPATNPAMPRLLSPIFAVTSKDTVLFPPYTLGEEELIRPVLSNRKEFDDLVAEEQISAFEPIPAKFEHELWLDDSGRIRYNHHNVVRKELETIFENHCQAASRNLKSSALSALVKARTHAMIAYSANPQKIKPLICRAAAEYRMISVTSEPARFQAELHLTESLAESHLSKPEFKKLYLEISDRKAMVLTDISANNTPTTISKYSRIATKRPAPPKGAFPELCFT